LWLPKAPVGEADAARLYELRRRCVMRTRPDALALNDSPSSAAYGRNCWHFNLHANLQSRDNDGRPQPRRWTCRHHLQTYY
jgi:hypothetical protein